jgi:hypothetical protein
MFLRFYCVGPDGRMQDRTQDCRDFGIGKLDSLTTRLDLIHWPIGK